MKNYTHQKLIKMTAKMSEHIEQSYQEYLESLKDNLEKMPSMADYLRAALLTGVEKIKEEK